MAFLSSFRVSVGQCLSRGMNSQSLRALSTLQQQTPSRLTTSPLSLTSSQTTSSLISRQAPLSSSPLSASLLCSRPFTSSSLLCTPGAEPLKNEIAFPATPENDIKSTPPPTGFAVVMVGGKQYKVVVGDVIVVEKMEGPDVGENIVLQKVLMVGTTDYTAIGCPILATARVKAHVEEQTRTEKVRVFKKMRRKRYRRNNTYRAQITTLRILSLDFNPEEEHSKSSTSLLRSHPL